MWKSMVATMYKWGTVDNNTVKTAFVLTGRITAADYKEITDESQAVAKAYDAACTPDFYFFDEKLDLIYRGQMDDSRPGNQKEITGEDYEVADDKETAN